MKVEKFSDPASTPWLDILLAIPVGMVRKVRLPASTCRSALIRLEINGAISRGEYRVMERKRATYILRYSLSRAKKRATIKQEKMERRN